jgi:PAS domain S-box-containing protein
VKSYKPGLSGRLNQKQIVCRDLAHLLYSGPFTMSHSKSRSGKFDSLRLLIENVKGYAICTLDPNGFILTWNIGAQQLKGYTAEQIVGQHFSRFYTPEDIEHNRHEDALLQARCDGWFEEEGWRVRKDGSRFRANIVIFALRDETGTLQAFGEISREIGEHRGTEGARRLARLDREEIAERVKEKTSDLSRVISDLEKTSRLKDDFLAMVSHELLTPLTSASGWLKLIRGGGLSDAQVVHALEVMDRSLSAQRDLIQDLLNVSRVVSGNLKITPQAMNPARMIEETVDSLRPSFDAKQLQIGLDLDSGIVIQADPVRFQQIVWNLLTNAAKFTLPNGWIRVLLKRSEGRAILSVSDTGEGIAREFLPYVFDRFRQAPASRSGQTSGLGLGLAIVRHLVELHGGTILVNSRGLGHGSTFSVSIPICDTSATPSKNRRAAPESFFLLHA